MRIARFLSAGQCYTGQLIDDQWALAMEGSIADGLGLRPTAKRLRIEKLLAPLIPTDILCIGLNYREHAKESGAELPLHPVLFIKAGNTLNNPSDPIVLPRLSQQVDYEAELAIVIGRTARRISREDAMGYILGYTCANDVSARDWQRDQTRSGGQWCRAKGFDGFCPLGPWIVTTDELPNPNALRIRTILNGTVMQDSNTSDMIFDIPAIVQSLSSTMTLSAGTVILTGTPPGVGFARRPPVFLRAGDQVVVEIEKIGTLANRVTYCD